MISRRVFLGGTLGVVALPRLSLAWGEQTYFEVAPLGSGAVRGILGAGGNSLLLTSAAHTLLVDCKTAPFGGVLRADAEKLGFDPDSATVVNTHHHADHSGGNHAFRGIEIIAHANADPRIRGQVERYTSGAAGALDNAKQQDEPKRGLSLGPIEAFAERAPEMNADDFAPTRLVEAPATEIAIGETHARLLHFGDGHTDNDLAVHLPEQNVLHCGDLLFNRVHPYIDLPAGATTLGWIDRCDQLAALCDGDTVVVPGHGTISDVGAIREQKRYFERLRDAVRQEIDAGTTKEKAQEMSWAFMDGYGFEHLRPIAIGAVYDELSAGGG